MSSKHVLWDLVSHAPNLELPTSQMQGWAYVPMNVPHGFSTIHNHSRWDHTQAPDPMGGFIGQVSLFDFLLRLETKPRDGRQGVEPWSFQVMESQSQDQSHRSHSHTRAEGERELEL